MEERIPPQDLEAEKSLLGSLMISKDAVANVVTMVNADYFYHTAHMHIYQAVVRLFQKNEPIDIITLSNELKKDKVLSDAGGHSYLAEILNSVPTAANAVRYAEIVSEKAILRKLIEAGTNIVANGFDDSMGADQVMEAAQKSITELTKERVSDQFFLLRDVLMPVIDSIHKIYDNENKILGVPSGYKDLDQLTSGFQPSDLIILAARPSMGKTSLALNFTMNAALMHNMPVAIYSLEMPKEQVALRMLCAEAKIDSARLKTANMQEHEYKSLTNALGRLGDAKIYIEDSPGLSPLELKAKTRRLLNETDIKLIVIDYLQLMKSGKKKVENRFQEMSEIVREVKAFSRELKIPVIALSQLSRDVEKRSDFIPRLSDLRETGELEQTSDVVMFIHRPDYYEHAKDVSQQMKEQFSFTKVFIEKNRNGPTGAVNLMFRKDISKFYPGEHQYAPKPL